MKDFWLIWNPQGYQPRVQHDSERAARLEAERLAKSNPGQWFVVLKAVAACETTKPVQWHEAGKDIDDSEIPF